jgi:UDP-N-acetylglucosamine 2-epimerase (non-hydrolysing)
MANLQAEGLSERSHLVGDVMVDLLLNCRRELDPRVIGESLGLDGDYVVATVHRASNTDDPEQLARLIKAMEELTLPVVLVAHPRLVAAAQRWGISLVAGVIRVVEPLDYLSMLSLLVESRGLITDSGGLQKEAFLLGVPCTTLRTESEWPETLAGGMNVLAPCGENLQELVTRTVSIPTGQPYGDGHASDRIVDLLLSSS